MKKSVLTLRNELETRSRSVKRTLSDSEDEKEGSEMSEMRRKFMAWYAGNQNVEAKETDNFVIFIDYRIGMWGRQEKARL